MDFFNIEYTKYDKVNKIWKNSLFHATAILLLFLLFQPFGLKDKDVELKLVLFPGFALLAYLYAHINFRIVRFILRKKLKWVLWNELLNLLFGMVLLTVAVQLFAYIVTGDMPLTIQWYLKLLYQVASIFLFIGVIEFFYYNNSSYRINFKHLNSEFENIKQELDKVSRQNKDAISFSLEKEQIEINRSKIVFIQSAGNYLEFYLRESKGEIIRITKRGRLHQAEKDLEPFPEFFRCHRAFIINLNHTTNLIGNIKNARVIIDGIAKGIPVSRANYKILKDKLETFILS